MRRKGRTVWRGECVASLFIRRRVSRGVQNLRQHRQIPSRTSAANFTVGPLARIPRALYSIYYPGRDNLRLRPARRVPAAVTAVPQSAYRTFMRSAERTHRVVRNMRGKTEYDDGVRTDHLRDGDSRRHVIDEDTLARGSRARTGNLEFHLHP